MGVINCQYFVFYSLSALTNKQNVAEMSSQKLGNDMVSEIIDRKERNKERKEGRRKEKKAEK